MPTFIMSDIDFVCVEGSKEKFVKSRIPYQVSEKSIRLYPQTRSLKALPCIVTIDEPSPYTEKYICENINLHIVNFPTLPYENRNLRFKHGSHNIDILSSFPSSITIESNNNIKYFESYHHELRDLKYAIHESCAVITSSYKTYQHLIIIYQGDIIFDNIVREYSIDQGVLSCLVSYNDIQNQGRLFDIDLKSGIVKSELVYFDKPRSNLSTELIPCAFLESIRIRNLPLSRMYMSDRLSNKLDDDHLVKYFGSYDMIIPNNFTQSDNQFNIVYVISKKQKSMKKVTFSMIDGKIDNVDLK